MQNIVFLRLLRQVIFSSVNGVHWLITPPPHLNKMTRRKYSPDLWQNSLFSLAIIFSRATAAHLYLFLAHSKNELMQWRGVRRLSVCPSVCPSVCLSVNFCANRFFSQTNRRIATKLSQDGTPGQRASRVCSRSRSKVTWYAHFLEFLEWATPSLTVWFNFDALPNNFTLHYARYSYWRLQDNDVAHTVEL